MSRSSAGPDGVLVVDKPVGITSHDAVSRVRRELGTRRVGHAGTLDPMASGILVLGVGRATRLLTFIVGAQKEYLATIRIGVGTTTDDADGEVTQRIGFADLNQARILSAMDAFTGSILQVPSTVSAIKVRGKRAYARVRAGEAVELSPRPVQVDDFTLLRLGQPSVPGECLDCDVRVICSSGTYVRALARDLGAALGSAAHLTVLRRTRVGAFTLAGACTLDSVTPDVLMPMSEAAAACLPVQVVTDTERAHLVHGRPITEVPAKVYGPVAALDADGNLIAVVESVPGACRPLVVFADAGRQDDA